MPNTELLNRTLNYIEAFPERWNQKTWAMREQCGTSHCFAGWAVALAHPEAEFHFDGLDEEEVASFVTVDGKSQFIDECAADLLGLDKAVADGLFAPGNTLAELRRLVAVLTAGEPALDTVAGA